MSSVRDNVNEAFSQRGRERYEQEKRAAWRALKGADPQIAELVAQTCREFGAFPSAISVNGEVVFGEFTDNPEKTVGAEQLMATAIKRYWDRVRELPCVVSGRTDRIEMHHCHGGSVTRAGFRRGLGQKTSDWLVIPLHAEYHTGRYNPEVIGVERWEMLFGEQVEHLNEVGRKLGVNPLVMAREVDDAG